MRTATTPSGRGNSLGGLRSCAAFMNEIHAGNAADAPVSPLPIGLPSSFPTHTTAVTSVE